MSEEHFVSSRPHAAHRFNNGLRYGDADHPRQWHLTPDYILEPVRESLGGGIDLDPCTFADNPTQALAIYTVDHDGLSQRWRGNVYCNPPYGKAREPWVERCMEHAETGSRVVLLIPAATDTRIFQRAAEDANAVVFVRGRVKFGTRRENRRQHAASHPSALIGWNTDLWACRKLGLVMAA